MCTHAHAFTEPGFRLPVSVQTIGRGEAWYCAAACWAPTFLFKTAPLLQQVVSGATCAGGALDSDMCMAVTLSLAPCACAQERLAMQKEEAASNPEYGTTFKDALTKDEKKARRKAILANIGAA